MRLSVNGVFRLGWVSDSIASNQRDWLVWPRGWKSKRRREALDRGSLSLPGEVGIRDRGFIVREKAAGRRTPQNETNRCTASDLEIHNMRDHDLRPC